VIRPPGITVDPRDAKRLLADLLARRPGYVPEWRPSGAGAGAALLQITARYLQAIVQRLNQAPDKNKLAFLDLLGVDLVPARAARAPLVFRLAAQAVDTQAPAGTRAAAPPPAGRSDQIIFETERATGLAAARLTQVRSLWPGRDQYIDHSAAILSGQAFQPFAKRQLLDTPHVLYLAHDTLLALAGRSNVGVHFELTTPGTSPLDIVWEYWDGAVWRQFLNMQPECDDDEAARLDSTAGLTRSGRVLLEAECAESSKTTVGGIEACWIRGRLSERLPPDPARVLPEVESIRLGTEIANPIVLSWQARSEAKAVLSRREVVVTVQDEAGKPLPGVSVQLSGGSAALVEKLTGDTGRAVFPVTSPDPRARTASVSLAGSTASHDFLLRQALGTEVTFVSRLEGLRPDAAFSDGSKVDVTKPFYPLGLQPQPGSSFYFTVDELFTKPGAVWSVFVKNTATPQDQVAVTGSDTAEPLIHTLAWEYWNGREWITLLSHTNATSAPDSPEDFTAMGMVDGLVVPVDIVRSKVNSQEALWMRVRLVSGGFGFTQTVTWTDQAAEKTNEFTYVISRPPALSDFRLGYTWQHGPFHPEHVLAQNDFRYEDRTEEAKWPGRTFLPFSPVSDVTPALYLGFDKQLPVDRLGILFDIEEERGDTDGPPLVWQYWDGVAWQDVFVEDETHNLRLPGLVAFIGPDDSAALARFNGPLYWLRARLKEDGPPGEPTVDGIFPNAAWAVQRQTIAGEALGQSTGQPNQVFTFRQFPVLAGEQVEVRELSGPRANVEWRIVAREILAGDARAMRELEALLASEGAQAELVKGDLRLVRDRSKRVTEVWVHWESQRHFFFSGADDRHYVIDRVRGRILFGDGTQGRIPPLGAAVLAREYQSGGGLAGNVAAGTIKQLLAGIPGVESVSNAIAAEGGADTETLESFSSRGPETVRHRGRAVAPRDYETLAREANASVAMARALACRDAGGRTVPGWVTLVIIPQSADPRPWPSFGLREEVRRFVAERATADLGATDHIHVTGPDYVAVDVEATVAPLDPAEAGSVEQAARDALQTFLHPLRGGPAGKGWEPGRDVFLSDVASVLERVAGIDYVKELGLMQDGVLQGERVKVAPGRTAVAGDIRLKLVEDA
jgi:phage-related baseplate assembly protein